MILTYLPEYANKSTANISTIRTIFRIAKERVVVFVQELKQQNQDCKTD